jgi:hypothetical protein
MLAALTDQRRAALAWLVGGLPIAVSGLQSISALSGNTALYWIPIIGDISETMTSIPVVQEAALIFYSQTTIVLLLFLLIAASWAAQGVLMFTKNGREKSYSKTGSAGAVVLSGILYGFLFLGIYSTLFGTSVAIIQISGFFLIPVLTTGSLGIAYNTYSWEGQRRAEAIARIKSAQRQAKSSRRQMESELEQLPLTKIEEISSEAVREATEVRDEFYADCDDIINIADDSLSNSETLEVSTLENRSQSLEQQATILDVNRTLADLEDMLRQALDNIVDERFGNVQAEFMSTYGERYKTANLPEEMRTVSSPALNESVIISTASKGGVAEQLHNVLSHNSLPLVEAIELLDEVDSQIHEEVLTTLHDTEEEFKRIEERVEGNLETGERKIQGLSGHTRSALERIFIRDTENEETSSSKDVRQKLDEARQLLHSCELDAAIGGAEEAESMSEEYVESVEFIRSVLIPGIEQERDTINSVPHPGTRDHRFFTESLVESLREPLRNDFGADIQFDVDRAQVAIDHDVEGGRSEEIVREETATVGPRDEVKYLIREFQSSAGDGEYPGEGTISIDTLPSSVKQSNPVPEFVEFVESVDELEIEESSEIADTDDSATDDKGYLSVTASDGGPIDRIAEDLIDEYRTWADDGRES